MSLLEFVQLLTRAAQTGTYKIVPFPPNRKSIDIGDYYADCARIRSTLGWEPRVSIVEGLERTVCYYKKYREYYW